MNNDTVQDVIDQMGNRMAKHMDFEILCGFLIKLGWRKIILSPVSHETSCEIDDWVDVHIKGKYETLDLVWIFEREEDANWFALRWIS